MVKNFVGETGTAQKRDMSWGRRGPCCHWRLPVAKKSLVVLEVADPYPPRKSTPCLSSTTAPLYLGVVRLPILLSSQRWFSRSSTRQEAVSLKYLPATPPQEAMSGVGSDVLKLWWLCLVEGSGGGEEQLGNTSVDAVSPPPVYPPVISRTLSSGNKEMCWFIFRCRIFV